MKIIQPLGLIGGFYIDSNNLPSNEGYPDWSDSTTYWVGNRVFYQIGPVNYIYESLINNNLGNVPGDPAAWQLVGASNHTALWDEYTGTVSSASQIVVSVSNEVVFDSIAFLNLTGVSIRVAMVYQGATVYDQTIVINNDKYGYYWLGADNAELQSTSNLVFFDLPPHVISLPGQHDCVTTFTITGGNDPDDGRWIQASVGMVVFGKALDIANTGRGVKLGITDYSVKNVDAFGNAMITKRKYTKRMTANLELPTGDVDRVFNILSAFRSTPVVWIGNDNSHSSMIIWGFYKDFEIDVAYPSVSYCSLSIEGMI